MTRDEASRACKNGGYAAFISAAITTAVVISALLSNAPDGFLAPFNDPINFADIVLILACGFGMLRKSRAAAITIFIYFIFAKVFIGLETGSTAGIGGSLIFLYFFGKQYKDHSHITK